VNVFIAGIRQAEIFGYSSHVKSQINFDKMTTNKPRFKEEAGYVVAEFGELPCTVSTMFRFETGQWNISCHLHLEFRLR